MSLSTAGRAVSEIEEFRRNLESLGVRRTKPKMAAMWFRTLSLVIAVALLGKAVIALAIPRRFYAARERQYDSETLPPKLVVAPVIVVALTLTAWYANIFHYQPWGWVVTGSLTALACLAVDHVFRWPSHRQRMLKTVRSPKVGRVDCLLLAVGAGFAGLAFLVY